MRRLANNQKDIITGTIINPLRVMKLHFQVILKLPWPAAQIISGPGKRCYTTRFDRISFNAVCLTTGLQSLLRCTPPNLTQ